MKRAYIICQDLNHLAGTELETLITASVFIEKRIANKVIVFSSHKASNKVREYCSSYSFIYKSYPRIFNTYFGQVIQARLKIIFKFLNCDYNPLHFFYWLNVRFRFNTNIAYIITPTYSDYYIPVVKGLKKNVIHIRFTGFEKNYTPTKSRIKDFEKVKVLFVTCSFQKRILQRLSKNINVSIIDVFLWNEEVLINLERQNGRSQRLGMLCRISPEKNIEDGIRLIARLRNEIDVRLVVQGFCSSENYFKQLKDLIEDLDLNAFIDLQAFNLSQNLIPSFLQSIDCLIITSKGEGGPTAGLEAMASGTPVISYDVGAMQERLGKLSDRLIAQDFDDMYMKIHNLYSLIDSDLKLLQKELKERYVIFFSNPTKMERLICALNENACH
ncbi:glycosyltransferase family 4 protein [Leeuwenhoekiella sp. ZYFB001]|uniref:glycosyltransferase family 4 protein n=1 Tax=Leeuwenhoekiella sp. ZYFB001 TaxID=2719912 RepID=UPI00142F86DE|nr:glycosyltransferase [Leeuwenhoekiella sp. ZYFB001]